MAAKRERIQPKALHVRQAGGQVLYSQVMVVEVGGTRHIYVAGQVPRDKDGNSVGKGDMRAQIEQVGENIKAALEAAGASLADIVKTTTYVTDMDAYFKHQDMRMRYFAQALPTRVASSRPLLWARTASSLRVSPRLSRRSKSIGSSVNLPASILE